MAAAIPIQFAEPAARQVFSIRNSRNRLIFDFFNQRKKIINMEATIKQKELQIEERKIAMAREILVLEDQYQVGYNLALETKVTGLIKALAAHTANKELPELKEIEQLNRTLEMEKSIANDMGHEIDRLDGLLPKTDQEYNALRIKLQPRATVQEIDEDGDLV